jgi:hypothetical protein
MVGPQNVALRIQDLALQSFRLGVAAIVVEGRL